MHCALCCLQAPDKLRLLKEVREASGQYLPLDDAKKLADLKVENDDVVAMVYLKEGEAATAAAVAATRLWRCRNSSTRDNRSSVITRASSILELVTGNSTSTQYQMLLTCVHCASTAQCTEGVAPPAGCALLNDRSKSVLVNACCIALLWSVCADGSGFEGVKILAPGAEDDAGGSSDGAVKQEPKQEAQ